MSPSEGVDSTQGTPLPKELNTFFDVTMLEARALITVVPG